MIKTKNTEKISKPRHKVGDVVAAFSDNDDEAFVMGYVSSVETQYGKHYYTVEWNNGLCCDSTYDQNVITGYKNLLKRKLKNVR